MENGKLAPNFSDDEGRFWWTPPDAPWWKRVQIPHDAFDSPGSCFCKKCLYDMHNGEIEGIRFTTIKGDDGRALGQIKFDGYRESNKFTAISLKGDRIKDVSSFRYAKALIIQQG